MWLLRVVGVALVAVVAATAVSVVAYLRFRPAAVEGRGPQPPGSVVAGNVAAAERAAESVVRVETGPLPAPSPGATVADAPGGTGVVIDDRGYVLTASAVLAGAPRIAVAVPDRKVYDARVIGSDPVTGLSLLKIDASGLRAIDVAAGSVLAAGSGVVVVSAPPGPGLMLGGVGEVGAAVVTDDPARPGARRVLNDMVELDLTRRDAALGAAVVDGNGHLVALVVGGGGGAWAAPAADVQASTQQLIESGHVTYPTLGFTYQELSATEAADRGLPGGALVLSVDSSSAAGQAGLHPGDVVTAVGGTTLDAAHTLRAVLRGLSPDQTETATARAPDGTDRSLSLRVLVAAP